MPSKKQKTVGLMAPPPSGDGPGLLKHLGGSSDDEFNQKLVEDAVNALPPGDKLSPRRIHAIMVAMRGVQPREEIEGMLAIQLSTTHDAAMDCFSRAHAEGVTVEQRNQNLALAAKLLRAYGQCVEVLDRHQKKNAEERHVEAAKDSASDKQSNAPLLLEYQPQIPLRCADPQRGSVPVDAGEGEDPLQNARGRRRQRGAAW